MNRRLLLAGAGAGITFAAAACGGGGPAGVAPSPAAAAPSPAAAASPAVAAAPTGSGGTTVAVAKTKLGQVLVDGQGRTLYLFELDKSASSNCYNACAQAWPPLLTTGSPLAGTGASAKELGTTSRSDGTTEVTYHGHPLYFWIGDKSPGDVTGEAINGFGASWYVLAPSGNKIDNT